jgi:two-component system sensor histidine kinase BaeS
MSVRNWIAARLWRRLMVSQLLILVLIMLIIQCLVAVIVAFYVTDTAPIEGDAGWLARSYAQPVGWSLEFGQEGDVARLLNMVEQGAIVLPEPDAKDIGVAQFSISTGSEPLERLIAVTVLDHRGAVLATRGAPEAQRQYPTAWDELVGMALSGETNPYTLSRWLSWTGGGRLLGVATVLRGDGEIAGVVAVEMYPSIRLETSGAAAPLIGFLSIIAVTSIFGVPVLLLAVVLAVISGLLVARSLGRRLKQLETTAQTMASGDLTLRVEDTSPDEIGQVGRAFNQMAGQLGDSLQALEREKVQVEALLRSRRDLVANISHDLRTPIASLSAHLETLSAHPERLEEYLPILNDEAARTSDLIGDLFELARLDAHELQLDLAPTALSDVITRVAASYRSLAWERRRIVLEVELPPVLPPVLADVQRVEQVLANLITNGLRFTLEGGVITIEAERLDETVEVRVSDTGIGIPSDDLAHIFERFYRGDRARSRPAAQDHMSSGSGLGLAIVKGLVEAMDGSVSATSSPGEGTCIGFRLPLAAEPTPFLP